MNAKTVASSLPLGGLNWALITAGLPAQGSAVLAWSREPPWRFLQELSYERIKIGMVSGVRGEMSLVGPRVCLNEAGPGVHLLGTQWVLCAFSSLGFWNPSEPSGGQLVHFPATEVLPHRSRMSDLTSSQAAAGEKD